MIFVCERIFNPSASIIVGICEFAITLLKIHFDFNEVESPQPISSTSAFSNCFNTLFNGTNTIFCVWD